MPEQTEVEVVVGDKLQRTIIIESTIEDIEHLLKSAQRQQQQIQTTIDKSTTDKVEIDARVAELEQKLADMRRGGAIKGVTR